MVDDEMLKEFDPFAIFDREAERLSAYFEGLDAAGWERPSRCSGWSVKDVLGHLAGEELYNHACLDDDVMAFREFMEREGLSGYVEFNDWCVRQRRGVPAAHVLAEWREKNGETRRRMRAAGRDATLTTGGAGPYPMGLQAFHYASELATHADDVGVPVTAEESTERTWWRVQVGRFVLGEQGTGAQVELTADQIWVDVAGVHATLSYPEFVEATVGRLPDDHPLDRRIRSSLRSLA